MTDLWSVGIPSPRVESEQKVAGKAVYAGDIVLPGMLWVKVLRSPVAHARIKKIDTSRALAVPGVKTIVTGYDFGGARIGKKIIDMPILADGVVRYVGEKVVAVAAESELEAEAALDLIDVDYEELPVVLDPLEALEPSAPLLHPDLVGYKGLEEGGSRGRFPPVRHHRREHVFGSGGTSGLHRASLLFGKGEYRR